MTVDPFALTPEQIANARTPEQLAAAANGATTGQGSQDPTATAPVTPTAPSITSPVAAPGANPLPGQTAAPQNQSQPVAAAATTTSAPVTPVSGYTGPSIVDYLNSLGLPADRASLTARATSMGIQNYTGTAAQNTQMLNSLRTAATTATAAAAPAPASTAAPASTTTPPAGDTAPPKTPTPDPSDPYAGQDPITRQVNEYKDAALALGQPTVQQKIDEIEKNLNDLNNEQQDKIDNVNNNPWFSEGIRTTNIKKIQDSYAARTDALTNLLTLTKSLYTTNQAQIDKVVSGAETDRAAIAKAAQEQVTAAAALAKDNSVQSVGGRELLINKATGKTVADLGPTTVTAPKQTAADKTASSVSSLQTLISSGQKLKDGTPVIDSNGFITPGAWKQLIAQAPSENMTRAQFISSFGNYLYTDPSGKISSSYGLTPLEIKAITGALP